MSKSKTTGGILVHTELQSNVSVHFRILYRCENIIFCCTENTTVVIRTRTLVHPVLSSNRIS